MSVHSPLIINEVRNLIGEVLALGDRVSEIDTETPLLGNIPELDSMAVAAVITALEERYGFTVEDDDIDAETFESLASLIQFVQTKLAA